jgi:lipopolysaccharide transport system ATP-binding protein
LSVKNWMIVANSLSKRYALGESQPAYRTLRDSISDIVRKPLRAFRRSRDRPGRPAGTDDEVWALRDVSFEIAQGEVIGLIGRNGAGKSTLLKVLSRITEPTRGHADIYGRVGTLLEVGTGFHEQLTGRENIYLNGAIMGMKKADIARQFDSIVSFAEVEKFIDTPVKHYSSGMYLRLAFAVAAHLEPEIMFVDEVLAVGDVAFQKKCLGKMAEVARDGRTILFVSHNMGAIRSLCRRGIVLDRGTVVEDTDVSSAIELYHRLATEAAGSSRLQPGRGGLTMPRLVSHRGRGILQGDPFEVAATLQVEADVPGFSCWCILDDMYQRRIAFGRFDSATGTRDSWRGTYDVRVKWPALWLEPGLYSLNIRVRLLGAGSAERYVSDVLHLDIAGVSSGQNSVLSPQAQWAVDPA